MPHLVSARNQIWLLIFWVNGWHWWLGKFFRPPTHHQKNIQILTAADRDDFHGELHWIPAHQGIERNEKWTSWPKKRQDGARRGTDEEVLWKEYQCYRRHTRLPAAPSIPLLSRPHDPDAFEVFVQ
jgi:hypothetical protein